MKKQIGVILILGIGLSLFGYGVFMGRWSEQKQRKREQFIEEKFLSQYWDGEKVGEGKREKNVIEEKRERFLEEHLYGEWRVLEKVTKDYESSYMLTEMGKKEWKAIGRIEYQKEWVRYPLEKGQASFSNPRDMWIFGLYGGFTWGENPIYSMNVLHSDVLNLRNLNERGYSYQVKRSSIEAEKLIHVTYSLRTPQGGSEYLNYQKEYFGSSIYIDSNEFNFIYVEFCGLWKMKRVSN